ncbi:jg1085, partial [Pararge aegeria aegeria]
MGEPRRVGGGGLGKAEGRRGRGRCSCRCIAGCEAGREGLPPPCPPAPRRPIAKFNAKVMRERVRRATARRNAGAAGDAARRHSQFLNDDAA